MPLYRFEIVVEDTFPDDMGSELPDIDAARAYADAIAATHLADPERTARDRVVRIVIRDAEGDTIDMTTSGAT